MAANSARVMVASGSKRSLPRPLMMPRAAMASIAGWFSCAEISAKVAPGLTMATFCTSGFLPGRPAADCEPNEILMSASLI